MKERTQTRNFYPVEINLWKQVALFLTGWVGFQVIALIVETIATLVLRDPNAFKNAGVSMAINCCTYGILIIVLATLLQLNDAKKLLKGFGNYKAYIAGVVCFLAILAFNFLYSYILAFIRVPVENNVNETNIQSLTELYRIPSIIFFGVIGPICEELTYRVGLFSLCKRKSKTFAYIITIVVFAFIHFNYSTDPNRLINELLNLPLYGFAAFAFSFVYEHYGFAASTTAHIINNQISLALVVFSSK